MKKGNHKNEKKRKVSTDSSIHIDNDKHVTGNTKNDCVKGKDDQSGMFIIIYFNNLNFLG